MTWQELLKEKRIEVMPTGKAELDDLRAVAERSLKDAALPLSLDGKFAMAYTAARTLSLMAVRASGYRIKPRGGAHRSTFLAFKVALGSDVEALADYLDVCREKRNDLSYETAGLVSSTEADELAAKCEELRVLVESWIAKHHPEFT